MPFLNMEKTTFANFYLIESSDDIVLKKIWKDFSAVAHLNLFNKDFMSI